MASMDVEDFLWFRRVTDHEDPTDTDPLSSWWARTRTLTVFCPGSSPPFISNRSGTKTLRGEIPTQEPGSRRVTTPRLHRYDSSLFTPHIQSFSVEYSSG